jgi:hypothetical protein
MPKTQQKYGQGWDGVHYPEENGSWEFLMTEYTRNRFTKTDGLELQQPYSFIKDNVKDFTKQELHTNMDSL